MIKEIKEEGVQKKVRPSGLEPETYCLEGNCSIQLSYGRILIEEKI
jgi:hypothetical protein